MSKMYARDLLEDMDFSFKINKLDKDIQKYFIVKKIDFLNRKYINDEEAEFAEGEYDPSARQTESLADANNSVEGGYYLDAFSQLMDYIEDFNSRKSQLIFKEELGFLELIFAGIKAKILGEIDLETVKKNILDSMTMNSEINIKFVNTRIDSPEFGKIVELNNDKLKIDWLGKRYRTKEIDLINKIKECVIARKEKLLEVGSTTEPERIPDVGMGVELFSVKIDYLEFTRYLSLCSDKLFFEDFEYVVFNEVEKVIKDI